MGFWTAAPVPDPDPGFAGVTGLETFYEGIKFWLKRNARIL